MYVCLLRLDINYFGMWAEGGRRSDKLEDEQMIRSYLGLCYTQLETTKACRFLSSMKSVGCHS